MTNLQQSIDEQVGILVSNVTALARRAAINDNRRFVAEGFGWPPGVVPACNFALRVVLTSPDSACSAPEPARVCKYVRGSCPQGEERGQGRGAVGGQGEGRSPPPAPTAPVDDGLAQRCDEWRRHVGCGLGALQSPTSPRASRMTARVLKVHQAVAYRQCNWSFIADFSFSRG